MALMTSCITSGFLFFLLISLGYLWKSSGQPVAELNPYIAAQTTLWKAGEAEVDIYRIPLLTYTPKGKLLAVAEARKYSSSDAGAKAMVIRRSIDELGDKWEPMQIIVDEGPQIADGLNLGTVTVDDEEGIIFIMYTFCNHHYKCNVTSTLLVKSFDDGLTWTKPINISEQIGTRVFSPGPGFGFQKKYAPNKGRLITCGHGGFVKDGMYCVLSDDHGMTWRWGGSVKGRPYGQPKKRGDLVPDECQPVELPDGSIIVNMRNQYRYNCSCRMVTRSYDAAETFPMRYFYEDKALIEPACAAGLLYHRDVLFFSNPASTTKRVDLTLKWSLDKGTTWPGELQIWDKASAYSTMTAHPGSSPYVFILFEKGYISSNEMLEFVRVGLF